MTETCWISPQSLREPRENFDRRFFPAPMVAFEHYMWCDDRPMRPMTIYSQLIMSGPLDVELLQRVFPTALMRHPLLQAVVRKRKHGRWEWMSTEKLPLLDIAPEPEPMFFPESEWIDLEVEPGLRLWVRYGDNESRIVVQVHHAAADGRGGFNFLTEWLSLYARERGIDPIPEELPLPEYDSLFERGRFQPSPHKFRFWKKLKTVTQEIFETALRVDTLRGSGNPPQSVDRADALAVETLQEDEFDRLRMFVKTQNYTLNDWLLSQLFQATLDWQEKDGAVPLSPNTRLRLVVPFDLRFGHQRRHSAANHVSMKFLLLKTKTIRDRENLTHQINAMMEESRTLQTALLVTVMGVIDRVPGLLDRVIKFSGFSAHVVLSNLGDAARHYSPPLPVADNKWIMGDLTVEEVHFTAAARKGTPIAIGVVGYANRLSFISRADHRGFTPESVREFVRHVVSCMRYSISELPDKG